MTTNPIPADRVRAVDLTREGIAIARSHLLPSVIIGLIVGSVCAVVLATTGQSAAAEARVVSGIDDAGTRTIVVSDPSGRAKISATSVAAIAALDGVRWVIGLGPPVDVHNAALGDGATPVPARLVYGDLPAEIRLIGGRAPQSGEALIGVLARAALGASDPYTGVVGAQTDTGTVGVFEAIKPLADLDRDVLIKAPIPATSGTDAIVSEISVQADRVEEVVRIRTAIQSVIVADSPPDVAIADPLELVQLRAVISDELGTSSRRLMLLVLGAGLVVVGITLGGAVSMRRRDFGRRRALGASRSTIIVLVLTHTTTAAVPGAAIGAAIGLGVLARTAGSQPGAAFTAGVCVLAVLSAVLGAIPPAIMAALRDPVRILRVP